MTKSYFGYLLMALAFNVTSISIALVIHHFSSDGEPITPDIFLYFDSIHYLNIKNNGYESGYESAFFPLFPFLWKLLGLSLSDISVFNGLLYSSAVGFVGYMSRMRRVDYLTVLAIPSTLFFFMPYSESVFYVCGLLLLIGIRYENTRIQMAGLFLCCIARPTLPVISAAYIVCQLTMGNKKMAVYGAAVAVLGTLAAFTVHWIYTDDFLSYFSAFKTWDYNFKFPLLPFRSHGGNAIKQFDSYALLFGIVSIIIALRVVFRKIQVAATTKLGLLYVSFFTLLILGLLRGGYITSLNRFLFCSPFFALIIVELEKLVFPEKGWRSFLFAWVAFIAFSLLFSSYVHIQVILRYAAGAMIVAAYFTLGHVKIRKVEVIRVLFIVAMASTQIFMFLKFLRGEWVG